MWGVAVLRAALWSARAAREVKQRVDGVDAMRVCCCDAARDHGLRSDANYALCKALDGGFAASQVREQQQYKRQVEGSLEPQKLRQGAATVRVCISVFSLAT